MPTVAHLVPWTDPSPRTPGRASSKEQLTHDQVCCFCRRFLAYVAVLFAAWIALLCVAVFAV